GGGGLALFAQPVEHGDAVQIAAGAMLAADGEEAAGDRQLVGEAQELQSEEGAGEMQGRGQGAAAQTGEAAAGFDEMEVAGEAYAGGYAEAGVEIEQVHAATQEHMLAVVDDLGIFIGGRDREGSGAAAQERPSLIEIDVEAGAAESGGRGQTGEASADNDHAGHVTFSNNRWRFHIRRRRLLRRREKLR